VLRNLSRTYRRVQAKVKFEKQDLLQKETQRDDLEKQIVLLQEQIEAEKHAKDVLTKLKKMLDEGNCIKYSLIICECLLTSYQQTENNRDRTH
jgi:hypothetical protein